MNLRATSKRKATEELLLFREQTHSTKRIKISHAQRGDGYSLRSKSVQPQQQRLWRTDRQRKEIKRSNAPGRPHQVTAEPAGMPSTRQFKSKRLALQQKNAVTVSTLAIPMKQHLRAALPARRSLRIHTKRKLPLQREQVRQELGRRRSFRRLSVPGGNPVNCEHSQDTKGVEAVSLLNKELCEPVAKHSLQEDKAKREDQLCEISHDRRSHQKSEAVEQITVEKVEVQELENLAPRHQDDTASSEPVHFDSATVDPPHSRGALEAHPNSSSVCDAEVAKVTAPSSPAPPCTSHPAHDRNHVIGGQKGQKDYLPTLLNIKACTQALSRALQSGCSLPGSMERVTAGVSYVVPSSLGLPHVTIRPAYPEATSGLAVDRMVSVLRDQAAIALVMPAHNEGIIKEYLKQPERRLGMAAQYSARFRFVHGTAELRQCLGDRIFTCLHYRLSDDFQLAPCTVAAPPPVQEVSPQPQSLSAVLTQLPAALTANGPASKHGESTGTERRWCVADSNVQVGLLVRKGIGGTSPAKAAARTLHRQGILGRLLVDSGSQSQSTLEPPLHRQQGNLLSSRGPVFTPTGDEATATAEAITEPREGEVDDLLEIAQDAGMEQVDVEASSAHSGGSAGSASSELRVRLYTQSCRLEMYCAQQTWTALSREQQAVLVGAIQGLERHLSPLFAWWNHDALMVYTRKLAASIDLALQHALLQPRAPPSPLVRQTAVPAPLPHPAGAVSAIGAHTLARAPLSGPPPCLSTCSETAKAAVGVHAPAQPQQSASPAQTPSPAPAPDRAGAPAAGMQVTFSLQPGQSPAVLAPSTPCAPEAKPRLASPGAGLVIGVPCSLPAPLPVAPQAKASWPSPAATLGFLQQLFRGAASQRVASQPQPMPAAGAGAAASAAGEACTGGNAACSDAARQGNGSRGTSQPLGQQLHSLPSPQSRASPGEQACSSPASPKVEGESTAPAQTVPAPDTPTALPQSPSSCQVSSREAALQPATPPARPPTATLAATATGNVSEASATAAATTTSGHVTAPSATAAAAQGHSLPMPGANQSWAAGLCAPGDAASALVLASAAASALGALGIPSSAGAVPWPLYLIGTRDSFKYHLHAQRKEVDFKGRRCLKTEYFFHPNQAPENYNEVVRGQQQSPAEPPVPSLAAPTQDATSSAAQEQAAKYSSSCAKEEGMALPGKAQEPPPAMPAVVSQACQAASEMASQPVSVHHQLPPAALLPAGICTYTNFYTAEELRGMEGCADGVHAKAREGRLPPTCFHETRGRGGGLKRTKFFFGARYLWTAEQAADPASRQAAGVRLDVPPAPAWMQALAEKPLVDTELVPKGFFDAWALNMYHDGSEGIQSHFDDGTRFARPIFSVRLFSDSRLSFGTQLYGYTNGAFTVDMPRGCITVMEAGGYAVEGVKHCVRPADLAGKSAALIMRHINPACMAQARDLFEAQTLQMLRGWSMKDAPIPPLPTLAEPREVPAAIIERECWNVLDGCIQRLESPLWLPGSGFESQVAHVLDNLISKATNAGAKRKVPLARMVFSNAKRLKYIEEWLLCGSTTQSSPAPSAATAPVPNPASMPASPPYPSASLVTEASQQCMPAAATSLAEPCHPVATPAGGQAGCAGAQSSEAEQLLRGLLAEASEQDVSKRICSMAASEKQRLLNYMQSTLRRLPAAASQLDSFGDGYAPPPLSSKRTAGVGGAPPSAGVAALPAQAIMSAAHSAAQLKGHPGAVCAACELPLSAGQNVWACTGQCCQFFHSACAVPTAGLKCAQCSSDRRVCFYCKASGPPGELVKCSMGRCGHFYHRSCAAACPLTNWGASSCSFRCPAHYCARCGLSGDSMAMLQCRRCPVAYHARCRHQQCRVVSKKYIICPRHSA